MLQLQQLTPIPIGGLQKNCNRKSFHLRVAIQNVSVQRVANRNSCDSGSSNSKSWPHLLDLSQLKMNRSVTKSFITFSASKKLLWKNYFVRKSSVRLTFRKKWMHSIRSKKNNQLVRKKLFENIIMATIEVCE